MNKILLMTGLLFPAFSLPTQAKVPEQASSISEQEMQDIAEDAYVYLYPLVTMDVTRRVMTNVEAGKIPGRGRGPMNAFHHIRTFPEADWKDVVRPNFDTLYSIAWLDLSRGPVMISTPNTQGRYFLLPMLDMWTDVFASPGKRTTGTEPGRYAVVPEGWEGTLPAGVERIDAPSPYVWIIGRIQANSTQDFTAVNSIQDGFKVSALSPEAQELVGSPSAWDEAIDMTKQPLDQVNQMPPLDFFRYASELMKLHKPHITDQTLLFRLQRIGIVPGRSLEVNSPLLQKAMTAGAAKALQMIMSESKNVGNRVNGWEVSRKFMGVYGNSYLQRAVIAMIGLGANLPEDAIYPLAMTDAKGQPLNGRNKYILHFDKGQLPPVDAFWSLTMYDAQGFQVSNRLNRFALGDRDPLVYNPDGSLDIIIQNESPGAAFEANWLPAPLEGLGLTMRLYAPKKAALDGSWNPPRIQRVNP